MPGLPYASGPQWLYENVLRGKWVLAVAGTHGKTTTTSMLAWILEQRGPESGIPDRRRAAQFRRVGPAHRQRVLRDRGRRVRHRVLRQALEVRPLPAAHRDPQQPRIRSRRHLPRPGGDRDAVPSLRAHGAAVGPAHRQRRGVEPRARARARLLVGGRAVRGRRVQRAGTAPAPDWRIADDGSRAARRRAARNAALAARASAARPAQSIERARGARRGAPRRVSRSTPGSRRSPDSAASSAGSKCAGTARGVTVYDDFAHHPTAIATTIEGLRREVGRARILAVLEPRTRTR